MQNEIFTHPSLAYLIYIKIMWNYFPFLFDLDQIRKTWMCKYVILMRVRQNAAVASKRRSSGGKQDAKSWLSGKWVKKQC